MTGKTHKNTDRIKEILTILIPKFANAEINYHCELSPLFITTNYGNTGYHRKIETGHNPYNYKELFNELRKLAKSREKFGKRRTRLKESGTVNKGEYLQGKDNVKGLIDIHRDNIFAVNAWSV